MENNSIFLFNPTCEMAVANGSFSYVPPLLLQQMENDLAILPFLMANESDFVLTGKKPAQKFVEKLFAAGFKVPGFFSLDELENQESLELGSVQPWGWSPATHYKLRNLKEKCNSDFKNSPVFNWLPEHQLLFERETALKLLNELLENEHSEFFISHEWTGKTVRNIDEINPLLHKHQAIVVKAPLSSSGRGIQTIRTKTLNQPNRQWISGILKQQKYVVAEPWLDKLLDISFQFYIDSQSGPNYLGHSVFETNSNGQYQSTFIRPNIKNLIPEIDESEFNKLIETTSGKLKNVLKNSDYTRYYQGFMGVDALIFKKENKLKIQPCIEVNCRMNMGILSMFCERQLHPQASGKFSIYYNRGLSFSEFSGKMEKEFVPNFIDGKLHSGFYPLTEALPERKFGAYLYLDDSR